MTARALNPKNFRKEIGSAVWLLALLACFAPAEWNGDAPVYVANSNIVTDAELAERLGVSRGTIARWRRRLRAAGVIGWLVAPGEGRVFWVGAVNSLFGAHGETKSAERKSAEGSTAAKVEGDSTAPAVSRWLQ